MVQEKKAIRRAKRGKPVRQVAAVPFRRRENGDIDIMLITSRTTRRFTLPKGWPMKGKSGRKAATIEAREEAGVVGRTVRAPLGSYRYWKRLSTSFAQITVTVFLLEVSEELVKWPEQKQRERAWLPLADAVTLIDEPELAAMLASLEPSSLL